MSARADALDQTAPRPTAPRPTAPRPRAPGGAPPPVRALILALSATLTLGAGAVGFALGLVARG